MTSANYLYIIYALIIFMISNIARALRWEQLLEPIGYKPRFLNSLMSIMAGYLANLGIPRSGEFIRAGLLARYEDYKVEKVMGTIVTDRIADVLSLLAVILLGILFSATTFVHYFAENHIWQNFIERINGIWLYIGTASLLLISAVLFLLRSSIAQHPIGQKIISIIKGFIEGLTTIFELKNPWLFLLYTIIIWGSYYLMTYLVFFSFEPTSHLSPIAGLVVFIFGTFGIVIPSPGGMGSYHFLIGEGLALYGISGPDAFSLANILFFSVQIFCNVIFGILSFILLPIYNNSNEYEAKNSISS